MTQSPVVLFVCTGNICRSPMAEGILNHRLPPGSRWTAASAGVNAAAGLPASPEACTALGELGIDLAGHRSRMLNRQLVDTAAVVVVMTAAHREQVTSMFPQARDKTFLVRSFNPKAGGRDLADPIGQELAVYRDVRTELDRCMPELLHFLDNLELRKDGG